MSAPSDPAGRLARHLPPALAPRAQEAQGGGRVRLVESTILVLIALVLATATVYDTVRQSHINQRLVADLVTWRAYTGVDSHKIALNQELLGAGSKHEVACAATTTGPAASSQGQVCLAIWGPVRDGRRTVHGGWRLPPAVEDLRRYRHGCFGEGARGMCP